MMYFEMFQILFGNHVLVFCYPPIGVVYIDTVWITRQEVVNKLYKKDLMRHLSTLTVDLGMMVVTGTRINC